MKTCCSTLQCFWSLRLVHVASICALAKMRISYFVSSKYDCVTFISQAASKYKQKGSCSLILAGTLIEFNFLNDQNITWLKYPTMWIVWREQPMTNNYFIIHYHYLLFIIIIGGWVIVMFQVQRRFDIPQEFRLKFIALIVSECLVFLAILSWKVSIKLSECFFPLY